MPKDRSGNSDGSNGFLIAGVCFAVALGLGIGLGWLIWGGNNKSKNGGNENYWAHPVPPTPPGPEYQPTSGPPFSEGMNVPAEEPDTSVGSNPTARSETPSGGPPQVQVKPALVVFSQPHCPACKAFTPTWEQLKAELQGGPLDLIKTEDSDEMNANGITGIPTIRLYPFGYSSGSNKFATHQGDRSKENIMQFVQGTMNQIMSGNQNPQQGPVGQAQGGHPGGPSVQMQTQNLPGQAGMHRQYHQNPTMG